MGRLSGRLMRSSRWAFNDPISSMTQCMIVLTYQTDVMSTDAVCMHRWATRMS